MIKRGVFLLFTLGCISLKAQNYTPISFPKELPDQYRFDAEKDYNKLVKRKPSKGVRKAAYHRFAEMACFGKSYKFRDGGVYVNWEALEDYLNRVLQTILPPGQKDKQNIHVYAARDPGYNAFSIHDGTIFFNVGYIADITNEAALAVILAHEYAHYVFHDAQNNFRNSLRLNRKVVRNRNYEMRIDKAHSDRKQELRADSLGFTLARDAGYDIRYGFDNFRQFIELKNLLYERAPAGTLRESLLDSLKKTADHPEDENRVIALERIISKSTSKTGKAYIASEEQFKALQQQAKLETLNLLLSEGQLQNCTERAFRFYLQEPGNGDYVYYLLEGLRRMFFIKQGLKNKGFLALGFEYKLGKDHGILHHLSLLLRDPQMRNTVRVPELLDSVNVAFETNTQAFDYFFNVARRQGIAESYLTKALCLYQQHDSAYKDWLMRYAAFDKPKYMEFAEALINNDIKRNGGTKELVIANDIAFKEDHFYGYYNRLLLSKQRSPGYLTSLRSMFNSRFPQKQLVEINELAKQDFNRAYRYRRALATAVGLFAAMHDTSATDTPVNESISRQDSVKLITRENDEPGKKPSKKKNIALVNKNVEQVQLFIYEPEFWSLFKEDGLKSIEFLNITAFDDKTQLLSLSKVLNPLYLVFGFIYDLDLKYALGSFRYGYRVDYCAYSPANQQKEVFLYSDVTHYKMSRAYLQNEIYYAFKLRERGQKQ